MIVIGIGQTLRGDDEVGLAAVRLWMETYTPNESAPGLQVVLTESPGIGLLDLLVGTDAAILVDAVCSDAKPGTIHLLNETDLSIVPNSASSAHGWGVAETLALGRKVTPNSLPRQIILIGIEVGQVKVGSEISSDVAAALPRAATLIQGTIDMLRLDRD